GLVMAGYSLSTAMKAVFAFTASWPQFFLARSVERMGKGIRTPPRDAMIGDSEPAGRLGAAFGFRKMMDSAGAIIGPLIATFLLVYFSGEGEEAAYRAIFMVALVPAAFGVGMLFFLRENKGSLPRANGGGPLVPAGLGRFIATACLFSIGQMGMAFFILRSGELLPLVMVPVAYLAFNVSYSALSMPAGALADRVGARPMMAAGYVLFGMSCLVFAYLGGALAPFIGFLLLGTFMAINETASRVHVVRNAQAGRYASAVGAYQGLTGIFLLPANLIAGSLWGVEIFGANAPFVLSAAIAALASIAMVALVENGKAAR
ncbi:MAG TPA: MFS transporter, partial [Candidatus Bilamarchaeaceae archaeon]|nr:MFS transporter [Candidatus Bilamarchaeaceae archaeon]